MMPIFDCFSVVVGLKYEKLYFRDFNIFDCERSQDRESTEYLKSPISEEGFLRGFSYVLKKYFL